jgi:hypothetical protein
MKHLFYTALAAVACLFLFLSNLRGWTILPPSRPSSVSGPGRSGVGFHK